MRFAICNELFQHLPFDEVCPLVRELGYDGIEIAPFTLTPSVTELGPGDRASIRAVAERNGLAITGLHWLLAGVPNVHLTSPNSAIRAVTASYLEETVRTCADLGGSVLVFGSPKQRNIEEGVTREQAWEWSRETFRRVARVAGNRGVTFCLEPLAPSETNLFSTAAEAAQMVDQIDHPNFKLILDVKAMSSEAIPIPDLIAAQKHRMAYFHANDRNLQEPGAGDSDFRAVFKALHETGYDGWMSIEVFVYGPDPTAIARRGLAHLKQTQAASLA